MSLGDDENRRGSFQGISVSYHLFVLCMAPLSLILRKKKLHYEFGDRLTAL